MPRRAFGLSKILIHEEMVISVKTEVSKGYFWILQIIFAKGHPKKKDDAGIPLDFDK
jgi:hypothetical protein